MLDRHGRFYHDGERVEHPGLHAALLSWMTRHPEDHRPVLQNGYDWCYFRAEDALYVVLGVRTQEESLALVLSDGTVETVPLGALSLSANGVLYATLARKEDARFSQQAMAELAPHLEAINEGGYGVRVGTRLFPVPRR